MNDTTNEDIVIELLTLTYKINEYGTKHYYNKEGQYHRIYGPAVIFTNPDTPDCSWYKNGIYFGAIFQTDVAGTDGTISDGLNRGVKYVTKGDIIKHLTKHGFKNVEKYMK